MPLPEPVRGDHWDMDLPEFVGIPADVSIVNALNRRLGHVAVIPVTETPGPAATHVPLDGDAGLTRYDRSYADITALQPVDRALLLRQRGRLAPSELDRLTGQLRIYLGPLRPPARSTVTAQEARPAPRARSAATGSPQRPSVRPRHRLA